MTFIGHLLAHRRAGENTLVWHSEGLDAPSTILIESPAFDDGAPMPKSTAGKPIGDNISPALAWTGIPVGARELVLIVEDSDVPFARPITHAVARLDASLSGVPEGDLDAGAAHGRGRGAFGRVGYNGPRPIPGHGPHAYVFQLFALDTRIEADDTIRVATLVDAMRGHVIARGRLTGTYER
ncbi:YbhB/YbcL family Raf kinase inhibitor-like protein [Leifsonia sp. NPDC058248]|uniref:YbhB/YbcL family Raf kinase inhibitor-like protein n=1 Tax=Leifsonia sp. NPDC058248 TaxID=3346402 RepID=UPI0036DBFD57